MPQNKPAYQRALLSALRDQRISRAELKELARFGAGMPAPIVWGAIPHDSDPAPDQVVDLMGDHGTTTWKEWRRLEDLAQRAGLPVGPAIVFTDFSKTE